VAVEVYVGGGGKQWVEPVGGLQVGDVGDAMITGRDGDDTLFGDNVDFFATATFGTVDGADSLAGQHRRNVCCAPGLVRAAALRLPKRASRT